MCDLTNTQWGTLGTTVTSSVKCQARACRMLLHLCRWQTYSGTCLSPKPGCPRFPASWQRGSLLSSQHCTSTCSVLTHQTGLIHIWYTSFICLLCKHRVHSYTTAAAQLQHSCSAAIPWLSHQAVPFCIFACRTATYHHPVCVVKGKPNGAALHQSSCRC